MSSERLGIIAKMDVVEADEEFVTPVDFKKGKRPHVAAGAYEPERVRVCAQAVILEDNGYAVRQRALWYVASREKVAVALDHGSRAVAAAGRRFREVRRPHLSHGRLPGSYTHRSHPVRSRTSPRDYPSPSL